MQDNLVGLYSIAKASANTQQATEDDRNRIQSLLTKLKENQSIPDDITENIQEILNSISRHGTRY
jgi:hypothetical protein